MTSAHAAAVNSAGSSLRPVIDDGAQYQVLNYATDTITVLTADAAAVAASGNVAIATTGVATFAADQTGIIVAGDYITVAGVKYTIVSGATTSWVVSPAPAVAVGSSAYVAYQVNSFVDLLVPKMNGMTPVPEEFRMRFDGTGTLSATYQFSRVNPATGVATAITTAVATTAAVVWQGVAAVVTPQLPLGIITVTNNTLPAINNGVQNEHLRLTLTARTTTTTGRFLLLEMAFRRKIGPMVYNYPQG